MPMLEGQIDAVIGIDTHRHRHAAALLDPNGGVRATLQVPSDRAGHARLLRLQSLAYRGAKPLHSRSLAPQGLRHGVVVTPFDEPL
jgi:hypothetical protein